MALFSVRASSDPEIDNRAQGLTTPDHTLKERFATTVISASRIAEVLQPRVVIKRSTTFSGTLGYLETLAKKVRFTSCLTGRGLSVPSDPCQPLEMNRVRKGWRLVALVGLLPSSVVSACAIRIGPRRVSPGALPQSTYRRTALYESTLIIRRRTSVPIPSLKSNMPSGVPPSSMRAAC